MLNIYYKRHQSIWYMISYDNIVADKDDMVQSAAGKTLAILVMKCKVWNTFNSTEMELLH